MVKIPKSIAAALVDVKMLLCVSIKSLKGLSIVRRKNGTF